MNPVKALCLSTLNPRYGAVSVHLNWRNTAAAHAALFISIKVPICMNRPPVRPSLMSSDGLPYLWVRQFPSCNNHMDVIPPPHVSSTPYG